MSVITDEQRAGLQANSRFQLISQKAIQNFGTTIVANDGTTPPGVMTTVDWAKQRFIGYGVVQHPTSQDYQTWYTQMTGFLKDQDIWVEPTDPLPEGTTIYDPTIDAMVTANTFASIAEQTYSLRSQEISF